VHETSVKVISKEAEILTNMNPTLRIHPLHFTTNNIMHLPNVVVKSVK